VPTLLFWTFGDV